MQVYYDKDGNPTKVLSAVAKQIDQNYFIKSDAKSLYNVEDLAVGYHRKAKGWKLLKVTEDVFKLYLKFLITKKLRFLTQAERLYVTKT